MYHHEFRKSNLILSRESRQSKGVIVQPQSHEDTNIINSFNAILNKRYMMYLEFFNY
jgi:hypothetical protein